jgi:hypothetical protein
MIVCARCGAQNQPTNKFCLSCGAPVQSGQAPPPAGGASGGYQAPAPAAGGWGQPAPQPPAPAAAPPQPAQPSWGQPQQPPQWGQPQQPQQPAPAQWGQPQPPPQWGQPHQPQQPAQQWGQPQPHQSGWEQQPGGPGAAGGGFGPAQPHLRVGSPEGLNPFGATVGPGGQAPHPGTPASPHGAPNWQQHPPQDAALAATSPPPTADDFDAAQAKAPAAAPKPTAPPPPPHEAAPHGARDPEQIDANAPRALAGFLVSYEGNELGTFYPIHQGQNLVGRKGAAPGLAIELEHGTTSSRHALLLASARPGRIKIEDVGSTNGTFVGDLMLERGKKHELKDGDVVRFGGYVTIVKIV